MEDEAVAERDLHAPSDADDIVSAEPVPEVVADNGHLPIVFRGYAGDSPAMLRQLTKAAAFASFEGPILITGATGTGKRLFVNAIHDANGRRTGPLLEFDCNTTGRELIASELFGHEKGAFSGATKDKKGLVELADGGTLCLNEVQNLPLEVQRMLLTALDSKNARLRARRVGSVKNPRDFDVRIVCVTNAQLEDMIRDGKFLKDLYFRISTLQLRVPTLAERGPAYFKGLVLFLIHELVEEQLRPKGFEGEITVDKGAMECLLHYPWPGNVRELTNALYQAVISVVKIRHTEDKLLRIIDLPTFVMETPTIASSAALDLQERVGGLVERILERGEGGPKTWTALRDVVTRGALRAFLHDVFSRANGNISLAARMSGMDRSNLRRLCTEVNIVPEEYVVFGRVTKPQA